MASGAYLQPTVIILCAKHTHGKLFFFSHLKPIIDRFSLYVFRFIYFFPSSNSLYLAIRFRLLVVPKSVDDDQLRVIADYRSRCISVNVVK